MSQTLAFQYLLTPTGIARNMRITVGGDGRITALTQSERGPWDGFFALPGMPNAHSHAFQRALAGQGETRVGADTFWSWREAMYALANRVTPKDMRAIAAQAFADMLRAGFTSVAEFHYLHHLPSGRPSTAMAQAVLDAADEVGIRIVLLPVFYMTGGFSRAGAEVDVAQVATDIWTPLWRPIPQGERSPLARWLGCDRGVVDAALMRLTAADQMGELFKVMGIADPKLGLLPGFDS